MRVRNFIDRNRNLRIINRADGPIQSRSFDSPEDFERNWQKLASGANGVHIGNGKKYIYIMVFRG